MTACAWFRIFQTYVVVLQEAGGGGPSGGLRSFHKTLSGALNLLRFEHWFSSSFGLLDTHNVSRQPNRPGSCNAMEKERMGCRGGKVAVSSAKESCCPACFAGGTRQVPGRFCFKPSQSPLVAWCQRKGASGRAGELSTPGICRVAWQGNHQEPGLPMALAAANFMGFWDYKWDRPTCPCCLTFGGHDAVRLTQVTFDDTQRLQLHLLGFWGNDQHDCQIT